MALDLPTGGACFVDANIFFFHFVEVEGLSSECTAFLRRVEQEEIEAWVSPHVVADAVHKVMLREAATRFGLERAGLAGWLARHPERVRELSAYRSAAADILAMPVKWRSPDARAVATATMISADTGLLTNDALIVALMRQAGIADIATHDADFHRVAGLRVWSPRSG